MPKQITQAELKAVLELNASVNRKMLNLRKRLKRGASVEPGELTADADFLAPDYGPYAPSLYAMGLDIKAVSDQAETVPETPSKLVMIRGGNLEVAHV